MIIFKVLLVALLLFNNGLTQDNPQQLIKDVQAKYDEITDLTADFTQTNSVKNSSSGKFFYKKDHKLRIEFKNLTIITDGKTTWNFNRKENKVIVSNYDDSDPFALSLDKLIYDYPENSVIKDISKNEQKILQLTPKNAANNFKSINIWINKENLVTRVIFEDLSSNKTDISLSGYRLNTKLADSKFSFDAPKGSTIIDLR
jgi:outer membrane lipoprotein-sorting protein